MGSEKHFRKSRGRTVHKTCTGGHIPRFAKKIVCKKFVFAEKKGPHLTEKCIGVLNVSCCSLWVMIFFYRHNTLSVTEFPVFNIKCKTKLNYFVEHFIQIIGLLFMIQFLILASIAIDLIMIVCLFVKGLDRSIGSRIESVFWPNHISLSN